MQGAYRIGKMMTQAPCCRCDVTVDLPTHAWTSYAVMTSFCKHHDDVMRLLPPLLYMVSSLLLEFGKLLEARVVVGKRDIAIIRRRMMVMAANTQLDVSATWLLVGMLDRIAQRRRRARLSRGM